MEGDAVGSDAAPSESAAAPGRPLVVTVNDPFIPTVNVAWFALVIDGA